MINEQLWDAINNYVRACGGDPTLGRLSSRPLVPEIERIVRMYRSGAWREGVEAGGVAWAQQSGNLSGETWRAINNIVNPYEK